MLTLFHPDDGTVRVKGVESCTNEGLHPWLNQELAAIVQQSLPQQTQPTHTIQTRRLWDELG